MFIKQEVSVGSRYPDMTSYEIKMLEVLQTFNDLFRYKLNYKTYHLASKSQKYNFQVEINLRK